MVPESACEREEICQQVQERYPRAQHLIPARPCSRYEINVIKINKNNFSEDSVLNALSPRYA